MTIVALKSFQSARPFSPFYVKMADGTQHEVRHPATMAIGRATCVVFYPESDAWAQLDVRLMTEVGPIPPSPPQDFQARSAG